MILRQEARHLVTERCALACHGDLLKLSMFFRFNVIGAVMFSIGLSPIVV